MSTQYHSTLVPKQSDPEALEFLFVAREHLVQRIVDGIQESATSGNKHQRLVIGPRGIGKTHLVSIVYHRLRGDVELDDLLLIARFPEEPYIASYQDLLFLILQTLQQEYGPKALGKRLDEVLNLEDPHRAEGILERLLLETIGGKILLLIVENLDGLLVDLKELGQRKLRAFIQNHPVVTILATATSLTDVVTERKKTFYGFFKIHTLDPFSVNEAMNLLVRLAEHAKNRELVAAFRSPMARARVGAFHYLVGGNPRIYVLFYDYLSQESLDDLVRPFMRLMDELVPYYQARMSKLAPLQRRIIDILRRLRGAYTVKQIARQAMNTSQTISSQLGKLKVLGYVIQADSLGRSNFYELHEPLMRLCLDVKEQKGRAVELLVQFLRSWYSEAELEYLAQSGSVPLDDTCYQVAVHLAQQGENSLRFSMQSEFRKHQLTGNYQRVMQVVETALSRDSNNKESWKQKAECLKDINPNLEEQLTCWVRVAEIDPEDDLPWNQQDVILGKLGHAEEALKASAKAVELKPDNAILNRNHGMNLIRLERGGDGQRYLERAMELDGEPKSADQWYQRGKDYCYMNRREDAFHAYRRALELDPYLIDAWENIIYLLKNSGRYRLYHHMIEQAVLLLPDEPRLRFYFGTANMNQGRFEEALAAYERALELDSELDNKGVPVFLYRAITMSSLGRHTDVLKALEHTPNFYIKKREFNHAVVHAVTLMWMDRWDEGYAKLDETLARFEPALWSERDLYFIGTLLNHTQNPEIWRRFIIVWLEIFARYGQLTRLGHGLVRRIISLARPWISEQIALAWYQTWQELAGDLEEMTLPLRLLEAGVKYKATRDPRVLLGLAQEERRLLQPWLINLFKEESDEFDQKIENLLHTVKQQLIKETEEKRNKPSWHSPTSMPEVLEFKRLLENCMKNPDFTLQHILPGNWQSLGRANAKRLLRLVAAKEENFTRALSRDDVRVVAVERRPLSFSDWQLFQININEDRQYGALDVMASEKDALLLDGLSSTLFTMIEEGDVHLDSPERRSEYVRFICSLLRADQTRFHILDALEDLHLYKPAIISAEAMIRPWQHDRNDKSGKAIYTGTVLYADSLFQVTLGFSANPPGIVEMLNYETICKDLPVRCEHYDGPIRFATIKR